jgi:hypothetical protein
MAPVAFLAQLFERKALVRPNSHLIKWLSEIWELGSMPHPHSMPSPGFQAIILCGPGASLNTFTSLAEESPKALIPIANRPMVWYPLDWCYRMGISSK